MLVTIRNFCITAFFLLIGLYIVTLLQIQGILPPSELSENVIKEVVSKLESTK